MVRKKTIEEIYQRISQIEHILLRPDTYIGSVERETNQMHVLDEDSEKIVCKTINYVPGLYKLFDEIIVNAADNKIRDRKMDTIKVEIIPERSEISVYNNGRGIPIRIHEKEGVYIPDLIFGHLLTSSNYSDEEKKVTGGRNGYGAKLCNIFSKRFIVETADREVKMRYVQTYRDNMGVKEEPVIESYVGEDFTKITFMPDLERFKMDRLDEDTICLLKKRVYDLCGVVKGVKVFLNGVRVSIGGFKEYVKLYFQEDADIVHHVVNERWEVAFAVSEEAFQQISFVNSICTSKGGSHVNHVVERIIGSLTGVIQKKEKSLVVKQFQIKSFMFVFINSLIENPTFDSQTKECLTLRAAAFGSKCEPLTEFVKKIVKNTSIIQKITSFAREKQNQQLKKTDGAKVSRLTGIPKLEDANLAGTSRSKDCTLILTEGDSAKTLAVSGLGVVGRDTYGVFPLKGKLLNVREASYKQIMENAEICNIKKILGLQHDKVYEDVSGLRYGHLMIMTDQDHDGSHIKGLIINFLDYFYYSLLKIPGFLQEFITPIVRATKNGNVVDFFTVTEYEKFKEKEDGWHIKYYKGLGTSTSTDAKQYFSNLCVHVKCFIPPTEEDRELVDLAFNKKKADARKSWLLDFVPGTFLDQSQPCISIKDFVNKELIQFSMEDNSRSIPCVIDGLKPAQRKVLFSCFKKKLTCEMKVAQLVGYVSEKTAYHHGEQSLCSTIVNLAQDFVGSNNINLLLPIGQFGSRLQGGKDAASPRYIFTSLSPLARLIFNENDDPILRYLKDDNISIEPEFYIPLLPLILVNGAEGIGTGWSTSIPNFNPVDIIGNIRNMINGKDVTEMWPYYRNFRGTVEKLDDGKFQLNGVFSESSESIQITELPIGMWTQNYREFLESLVQAGSIKDFREYHTEKTVNFQIKLCGKVSKLRLSSVVTVNNMVCFDENARIKKYSTPNEILREFYHVRLRYYAIRRENMLRKLKEEFVVLENKARFIMEVVEEVLVVRKRMKEDIVADLRERGYAMVDNGYEYLLDMPILSLTAERIEKLNSERARKLYDYKCLEKKSQKDMWLEDLEIFERAYLEMISEETRVYDMELNGSTEKDVGRTKSRGGAPKKRERRTSKQSPSAKKIVKVKAVSKKSESDALKNKKKTARKATKANLHNTTHDSDDSGQKPWEKYNVSS